MANTVEQFSYKIRKMGPNDRPMNPIVILTLDHFTTAQDGDMPQISAHLINEDEINGRIEDLKRDLDDVGRRAKQALRRAQADVKEILNARISN